MAGCGFSAGNAGNGGEGAIPDASLPPTQDDDGDTAGRVYLGTDNATASFDYLFIVDEP